MLREVQHDSDGSAAISCAELGYIMLRQAQHDSNDAVDRSDPPHKAERSGRPYLSHEAQLSR
jgi:hypothetical protein